MESSEPVKTVDDGMEWLDRLDKKELVKRVETQLAIIDEARTLLAAYLRRLAK